MFEKILGVAGLQILARNGENLGSLMGIAEDKNVTAERGDFHHVVGNIQKYTVRKYILDFEDDFLPGGLIHIGQAFIHDQQLKILEKVPDQVDTVLLAQRQP